MRKYVDMWMTCGHSESDVFISLALCQYFNISGGRSRGRSIHLVVKRSSDDNPFQHNWSLTNRRHVW